MAYKYFKYPARYAVFTEAAQPCDICKKEEVCLDATSFFGEKEIEAVCENCLRAGRLKEIGSCTIDADVEILVSQLQTLHPDWAWEDILKDAKIKTDELEICTPPVVSWQDWKYPAADGDYCQFIGFAGKSDFEKLAPNGDGKAFFASTLYDTFAEDTDVDAIWNAMTENKIKTVAQSNNYFLLVYLFKSVSTDTYISLWDIC